MVFCVCFANYAERLRKMRYANYVIKIEIAKFWDQPPIPLLLYQEAYTFLISLALSTAK